MKKKNDFELYFEQNGWKKYGPGGSAGIYTNGKLFVFCDGTSWIISKTPDQGGRYAKSYKNMLPALKFADAKK